MSLNYNVYNKKEHSFFAVHKGFETAGMSVLIGKFFFFPMQIKGASPEMVEYIGMKNLLNVVKQSIGLRPGKLVFGFDGIFDLFFFSFLFSLINTSLLCKQYLLFHFCC